MTLYLSLRSLSDAPMYETSGQIKDFHSTLRQRMRADESALGTINRPQRLRRGPIDRPVLDYIVKVHRRTRWDSLRFFDGSAYQIAPFRPGAVVITDTWIAKQAGQDEPGMRGTLTDTAVRDDVVLRLDILAAVDLAQLLSRLERTVGIGGSGPGYVLGSGNMATALRTLLRIVHHMQQLAGIFLRRAHVDQATIGFLQSHHDIIAESPYGFIHGLRMISNGRIMRHILAEWTALCLPFRATTIHDLHVSVTIHGEEPV